MKLAAAIQNIKHQPMSNFNQLLRDAANDQPEGFEAGARWAIKTLLERLDRYEITPGMDGLGLTMTLNHIGIG